MNILDLHSLDCNAKVRIYNYFILIDGLSRIFLRIHRKNFSSLLQ